jgi:predicted  nucleic acid-binding Zn-ribbon protein
MKLVKSSCLRRLITLFILCFISSISAKAQSTKQPDDNRAFQSLMNEVRLLRQTLQRTGLNAYRSQIIVERLRAHAEKSERLSRMLEDIRNEIEKIEMTIPRMVEQDKILESQVEQEPDLKKRARLEFEIKNIKQNIEHYKQRLERQRERELQLSTQLRAEQTKLGELESRLDGLEREIENEIERLQGEEKAQAANKQP